jgi:uncharacterized integral membrane protein
LMSFALSTTRCWNALIVSCIFIALLFVLAVTYSAICALNLKHVQQISAFRKCSAHPLI